MQMVIGLDIINLTHNNSKFVDKDIIWQGILLLIAINTPPPRDARSLQKEYN